MAQKLVAWSMFLRHKIQTPGPDVSPWVSKSVIFDDFFVIFGQNRSKSSQLQAEPGQNGQNQLKLVNFSHFSHFGQSGQLMPLRHGFLARKSQKNRSKSLKIAKNHCFLAILAILFGTETGIGPEMSENHRF